MTKNQERKVAIVGAGAVGSSIAFALVQANIIDELAIIDIATEKVEGDVLDLTDAAAFSGATKVVGGSDYKHCKNADIIIITAGAPQKPGETRMDLVKKNTAIMTSIVTQIVKYNKTALLIIIANPVDILTAIAQRVSGFAPEKVIGTGTLLDSGRIRAAIAQELNIASNEVEAYVLGEHGDSQFVPWSLAQVSDNVEGFAKLTKAKRAKLSDETMHKAYTIIGKKGATYYGIAAATELLVTHILEESNEPLPVSTYQQGEDGEGYYITCSLSCVGLNGVRKVAFPELEAAEIESLLASVTQLRAVLKSTK